MPSYKLFEEQHPSPYPSETLTRGEFLSMRNPDRDQPIDMDPIPIRVVPMTISKKLALPSENTPCKGSELFHIDDLTRSVTKAQRQERDEKQEKARQVCFGDCILRFSCLGAALALGDKAYGVLGGTTEKMRRDYRKGKITYKVLITKPVSRT
jgi:hypothetical protein